MKKNLIIIIIIVIILFGFIIKINGNFLINNAPCIIANEETTYDIVDNTEILTLYNKHEPRQMNIEVKELYDENLYLKVTHTIKILPEKFDDILIENIIFYRYDKEEVGDLAITFSPDLYIEKPELELSWKSLYLADVSEKKEMPYNFRYRGMLEVNFNSSFLNPKCEIEITDFFKELEKTEDDKNISWAGGHSGKFIVDYKK